MCPIFAVFAIDTIFSILAIGAIFSVHAILTIDTVFSIDAIFAVLAIDTVFSVDAIFTVLAIDTVFSIDAGITFGTNKGSKPFFNRAGKRSGFYGNVVCTLSVLALFSYYIRDIAWRMVRQGTFRFCFPENRFYDKVIGKPSIKICIFILRNALAHLIYPCKVTRYLNHIYSKSHILLKGRMGCVGVRPLKRYAVFRFIKRSLKVCNGRSQTL